LPIITFLLIDLDLNSAFLIINFILSTKKPDPEKLSAYESGFLPFVVSRMEFDVRFYLVEGSSPFTPATFHVKQG